MAKPRIGAAIRRSENGKRRWYGRITFFDENGKLRRREQRAKNKTHARELAQKMMKELEERGPASFDASTMTFNQLADYYDETYLIDPVYVDGRKIAGLRSKYDIKLRVGVLKGHFGRRRLKTITYGDIERYRAIRLSTPVVRSGKKGEPMKHRQRSIATVNRELSILRRLFNIAMRNGWLIRNPIEAGQSLIAPGDEKPRERILTREEEDRLLTACVHPRAHLRPILVCALDTGMRRSEILKLSWSDIDFAERIIRVRAFNTKTLRERQVAMTSRLAGELWEIYQNSTGGSEAAVFGIIKSVNKSFTTARTMAGLGDVRFHDLRHTHATRLVAAQMPLAEVGRVLGHTHANTTYRYVNANVETARRAAAALDKLYESTSEEIVTRPN